MNILLIYILLGIVVMFIYYLVNDKLEHTLTNALLIIAVWPTIVVFDMIVLVGSRTKQIIKYWRGL
jgi:uncharacterized membrane protein YpjA